MCYTEIRSWTEVRARCLSSLFSSIRPFGPFNRCFLSLCALFALLGCSKNPQTTGETNKIRVGYIGLTCEAPIFSAVEKGFFKEEGLEVSLVKCEWSNYKDVLALGDPGHRFHAQWMQPKERRHKKASPHRAGQLS